MAFRWPLHVHITVLFVLLVLATGATLAVLGINTTRNVAATAAGELIDRVGSETAADVQALFTPAEQALAMLAHDPLVHASDLATRSERVAALSEALRVGNAVSAVYVGYADGDFLLLRTFVNEAEARALQAPNEARYLLQSIEREADGSRQGRFAFLRADLSVVRDEDRSDYPREFDPRSRPWYLQALGSRSALRTDPYRFFTSGEVGVTIALDASVRADAPGGTVVGADLALRDLRAGLMERTVTPGSHLALVARDQTVLAHAGPGAPAAGEPEPDAVIAPNDAAATDAPADRSAAGANGDGEPERLPTLQELRVPALALAAQSAPRSGDLLTSLRGPDGTDWRVARRSVTVGVPPDQGVAGGSLSAPWDLWIAVPDAELMAASFALRDRSLAVTLAVIVIAVLTTSLIARRIARPLAVLAEDADAIRRFEFGSDPELHTNIVEVDQLADAQARMKASLRRFLEVSRSVADATDFALLQRRLLREMVDAANATHGVLLLTDDGGLRPAFGLAHDGASWPLAKEPLDPTDATSAGLLIRDAVRERTPLHGTPEQLPLQALGLDPQHANGSTAILAVPLTARTGELVGLMLLLRHAPVEASQVAFLQALAASATTSVETRRLIDEQARLFDSLIRMLAGAIDAKSPYTGGHNARVPEIVQLLARAASDTREGPYADFSLSDTDWDALRVAAWLHDAGKVTTPEFVVDKATKLETVSDRIHEIRTRFEVAKREAEVAALRRKAAGEDVAQVDAWLTATWVELDDDFAFVARCNVGDEAMNDAAHARLTRIAERRFTRTLCDRIGVSHHEAERKAQLPEPDLPVQEPLLADRPDHRFPWGERDGKAEHERLGIRMERPEVRFDQGELHNLRIARGTLTREERYAIQDHVVQTIAMLERLPFPRYLRSVPEIAAAHHERIDGEGYPRRLTGAEMSPQARMLAIADVFEALTAADRPYKPAKTLSESVRILSFMAAEGHVDPDLFRLFLESGAYRRYAEQRLRPDQIDEVDVEAYLNA